MNHFKPTPPRLARITGTATDHAEVDVTGWVHSLTQETTIGRFGETTYIFDITLDGQRQKLRLSRYTAELKEQL